MTRQRHQRPKRIIRRNVKRRRKSARLAEHQAQLALFVEQAPVAIGMFDTQMRCLAASSRFIADHRAEGRQLVGFTHYKSFPEIPQHWREIHARVLAGEELSADEDPFLRADGRIDWFRWSMKPWRTPDGRIGGALMFIEMINEQVESRRALAASEMRFRATFESAPVGVAHVDADGRWLMVNEALCRILGYPADELTGKTIPDVTYPDDIESSLARLDQVLSGKIDRYAADKRYVRKDGTIVWARLTVNSVRKPDGSMDYLVTMVEDISARKRAEEELRKSEERFRTSLVHSPLPVLLYDDRQHILAVSHTWLEESGYAREELRSMKDWTDRACGEHSEQVLEYIRQTISTEPEVRRVERMIRTKDGRERLWSIVNSGLGAQSDGRRLFIAVAQDVTERRAHEEQIQLLMREVNHRAKNMLSLVQVIARQTAAHNFGEFIDHFTERLQALAANQDLLVRNEWRGVEVRDLARAQLAHFADLIGSRIAMHGPRLRLNPASAQAIGLALHELATNAGKYGALSTDRGCTDICWEIIDKHTFRISWIERDGPPVIAPQRRGFGTTVIEAMAQRSLDGRIQLDYAPSGVTWRLSCPLTNALEAPTAELVRENRYQSDRRRAGSSRRIALRRG